MKIDEENFKSMPAELQALFRKCPNPGSDEVLAGFPESKSTGGSASLGAFRNGDVYGKGRDEREKRDPGYGDTGSAARFFYCAKASRRDRDEGCEGLEERTKKILSGGIPSAVNSDPRGMSGGGDRAARNHHPTVKPTTLMQYLCRLVTPPGGTVLDPFMGSGSTGKAAMLEGFNFVGIDLSEEYVEIANSRIEFAIASRQREEKEGASTRSKKKKEPVKPVSTEKSKTSEHANSGSIDHDVGLDSFFD